MIRASRGAAVAGASRRIRVAAAGVVLAGALLALAGAFVEPAAFAWSPIGIPVLFIAMVALMRPFEPAPGEKFTLGAAVAFFAAVILPGATAVAVMTLAVLAARSGQRRSVLSTAVNVATVGAATAAASLVLHGGLGPRYAIFLAATAYVGVTLLGVGVMILASSGAQSAASFVRRESLPTATVVALGGIAALLWKLDPITVALLVPPLVSVDLALRAAARQRATATALADSFESQRQFTEDAAHELRTPLTALIGNLDFIRRAGLDPLESEAIADARQVAEGLRRLTERLLALSRSGVPSANGEVGDLADAAREALARTAPRPGVTVALVAPLAVEVPVPAELLATIAGDLLANAAAYTQQGRIDVRVDTVGSEARLSVVDTGVGIPDDELTRVFDRFYRGAGSRALGDGSGLGLAIVRRVVEAHGGSVRIASRVGEGTSVEVRLPVNPAPDRVLVRETGGSE